MLALLQRSLLMRLPSPDEGLPSKEIVLRRRLILARGTYMRRDEHTLTAAFTDTRWRRRAVINLCAELDEAGCGF